MPESPYPSAGGHTAPTVDAPDDVRRPPALGRRADHGGRRRVRCRPLRTCAAAARVVPPPAPRLRPPRPAYRRHEWSPPSVVTGRQRARAPRADSDPQRCRGRSIRRPDHAGPQPVTAPPGGPRTTVPPARPAARTGQCPAVRPIPAGAADAGPSLSSRSGARPAPGPAAAAAHRPVDGAEVLVRAVRRAVLRLADHGRRALRRPRRRRRHRQGQRHGDDDQRHRARTRRSPPASCSAGRRSSASSTSSCSSPCRPSGRSSTTCAPTWSVASRSPCPNERRDRHWRAVWACPVRDR